MSAKKQPATLPGMEPATPSPHPLSTEDGAEAKQRAADLGPCVVCGYAIGSRQSFVSLGGRYRHATCKDPRNCGADRSGPSAEAHHSTCPAAPIQIPESPAEHHPLAGGLAATFGRETDGGEPGSFPLPSEPATPKKRKERKPRTPARAAVYIERMLAKYTLQQRRAIYGLLSAVCEEPNP